MSSKIRYGLLLSIALFLNISIALGETKVLKTVENQYSPVGKIVEIQKIDLIEEHIVSTGGMYGTQKWSERYYNVYVYSRYDLSEYPPQFLEILTFRDDGTSYPTARGTQSRPGGPQFVSTCEFKESNSSIEYSIYKIHVSTDSIYNGRFTARLYMPEIQGRKLVFVAHDSHTVEDPFLFK